MGILSNMVSEGMGTPKTEAESARQQRAAAATKLGGDGIERALAMKERTLSQLEAAGVRDTSRDAQKRDEEEAGSASPRAQVTYSMDLTGNLARQHARDNGYEL
ncbi:MULTISPECIES: hypothetical protein [Nocardiaceae]|jgi:hypothetical protein|uniref:hypothetical protein n=2 Tax=Mycobacteriales TaxID=85007 RepID=UPI00050C7C7B|nr:MULTISPECIES: hypothetical protein [Rhodococcus]KQU35753.1 hypothetical protein ASH04_24070 [Rhodococcus sp. Leaf233]MBP2527415.1 hypothetical protein [Rhodococcus sp. PvP104]